MENQGNIIQMVRIKSGLSEEELLKIARDREPEFRAISGLIQKYYVKLGPTGEYGGIYIWESADALSEFRTSQLAVSIPKAYQALEPPTVEIVDIMFQLRESKNEY